MSPIRFLELEPRYSNGTKYLPQGSPSSCPRSADRLIFEIRAGMEERWKHGSGRRMTGDMSIVEAVGGAVVLDQGDDPNGQGLMHVPGSMSR